MEARLTCCRPMLALALAAASFVAKAEAALPTTVSCPSTAEAWHEWRDREFRTLARYGYTSNARFMAGVFAACQDSLRANPTAAACMRNLQAFTKQKLREKSPGHSLGLPLSDQEYFASAPDQAYFQLPEALQSQEFLQALDRGDAAGLASALSFLASYNQTLPPSEQLTYFVYHSKSLPAPDASLATGRLFVHLPHQDFEQFIQYALREGPTAPVAQSVSLIAVQKAEPRSHLPLLAGKAYYNDLYRVRRNNGIFYSTRLRENQSTLENCTGCHKTPLLPIIPAANSFDRNAFGEALAVVNQRINHFAAARSSHFELGSDGPALGEDAAEVPLSFISQCSAGLLADPASLARVRAAMNCAECHNNHARGALTFTSINAAQLPLGGNLIKRYVEEEASMPPDTQLSPAERRALVSCLTASYSGATLGQSGQLERWLLQPDCNF